MSINVTVNGNRLNIRRGRMVLSDLDQIKKNERDRRRRLRLEQVRQQSKEISDRLLKRTKCIAKEELEKLENNDKTSLRQIYNGKIMEVQQKYQEDMADIGQAHISAALEPDHDALMDEQHRKNQSAALKRGKEATKKIKNIQQKEAAQHQERLHLVREMEDLRSTMIANLSKKAVPEENTICISIQNETDESSKQQKATTKKKTKKHASKKSPGKVKANIKIAENDFKVRSPVKSSVESPVKFPGKAKTMEEIPENDSILEQQSTPNSVIELLPKQTVRTTESDFNNQENCKKETTSIPAKDKTTRYNPNDYVQTTSDFINSDSSPSSFSDDSSYFSDSSEQYVTKETKKTPKYVKCPATDKVQLYDRKKHHGNVYDQPAGVVEKIHTWNEPSAMDLAREIERAQTAEARVLEDRREKNAKKRGENAVLREKVRRDYRTLVQNLDQLTSDERKLKASQVEHYPRDTYMQEERRKILRERHKTKLNRALKTLLDDESLNTRGQQCVSYAVERPITLVSRKCTDKDTDDCVDWEGPCRCFSQPTEETSRISQNKCEENGASREEQILDMLKKVERQKRLLLQEFGADLPNDIFDASVKSLFERDKSVQAQLPVQEPFSPEIKVIDASFDEKCKKDEGKERLFDTTTVKKVEIAVQTATEDKVQDKGTQVEFASRKGSVTDDVETIAKHYPIEPKITIVRQEAESSESTSSETTNEVTDDEEESPEVTLEKKKYVTKTKLCHKSCLTRPCKPSSPTKKYSKFFPRSQQHKKDACTLEDVVPPPSKEDVETTCTDRKPPQVAEIAIDVSTQSTQVYSTSAREEQPELATSKQQWTRSKSRRIKIKDISDTSTSFASPPPVKPRDILEALSNNLSILELLDSSASESIRLLRRRDISPVSTPETPSPRTMRMPSNIPDLERIKRLLRYPSVDVQTDNNNTLSSSTRNDYSTSIDTSQCHPLQNDHPSSRRSNDLHSQVLPSLGFCVCNNPECEQMHAKFDEIRSYALKNCPQILQKYEDLQTICAERIVSLTNLIEKVRNEQRGMELSTIDSHDETSLMQLPEPRLRTTDLENVHRLVESIEAIHSQLARTLIESQRIIKSKAIAREELPDEIKEKTEIAIPTIDDNAIYSAVQRTEKVGREEKARPPKIINEEKVNIQLSRFRVKPWEMLTSTPKHDTELTRHYEEGLIEKISKEILEQSKAVDDNFITSKEISTIEHSIQTSTGNNDFENICKIERTGLATTRQPYNKEGKTTKDFVPNALTDAAKVSKAVDNLRSNGRSKPPVSLLSGPYRPEIESSGHELSTIIELDAPDTANKSQSNGRSPLSARNVAEIQVPTKSTAIVKPSEHVSHSLNQRNKQQWERLRNLSPSKELVKKETSSQLFVDSPKTCKNIGGQNSTESKKEEEDKKKKKKEEEEEEEEEAVQETSDDNTDNRGSPQTDGAQLLRPGKECCKDNGDKITSTSSNSFSELSGVSQIASTPSSTVLKYASSPEEMEIALKKLGLGWAITTLKKTREASALSSSSNSDVTPMNTGISKRISPVKKQLDGNYGLPDFSDVSSISIKEASKSTEQAVLLKGRTSTPKLQNSNSNSERTNNTSNTNVSENFREPDDGLIVPNVSLAKTKSSIKRLENPR